MSEADELKSKLLTAPNSFGDSDTRQFEAGDGAALEKNMPVGESSTDSAVRAAQGSATADILDIFDDTDSDKHGPYNSNLGDSVLNRRRKSSTNLSRPRTSVELLMDGAVAGENRIIPPARKFFQSGGFSIAPLRKKRVPGSVDSSTWQSTLPHSARPRDARETTRPEDASVRPVPSPSVTSTDTTPQRAKPCDDSKALRLRTTRRISADTAPTPKMRSKHTSPRTRGEDELELLAADDDVLDGEGEEAAGSGSSTPTLFDGVLAGDLPTVFDNVRSERAFARKVVSAGSSYDAASRRIPQSVLHLCNEMALTDLRQRVPRHLQHAADPRGTLALPLSAGKRGGSETIELQRLPRHPPSYSVDDYHTCRGRSLFARYTREEHLTDWTRSVLSRRKRLQKILGDASFRRASHVSAVTGAAPRSNSADPTDDDTATSTAHATQLDIVLPEELERLARRIQRYHYLAMPYKTWMLAHTVGATFGLLLSEHADRQGTVHDVTSIAAAHGGHGDNGSGHSTDAHVHGQLRPNLVELYDATLARPFANVAAIGETTTPKQANEWIGLVTDKWGVDPPRVVVNVIGGWRTTPRLSRMELHDLGEVRRVISASNSAWFVTSGWGVGIAGIVAELLHSTGNSVPVIGMSLWELLHPALRAVLAGAEGRFYATHVPADTPVVAPGRRESVVFTRKPDDTASYTSSGGAESLAFSAAGGSHLSHRALPNGALIGDDELCSYHSHHVLFSQNDDLQRAASEQRALFGIAGDEFDDSADVCRRAEWNARMRFCSEMQNHSSSGSFGIRSNVTSVGLVIAGGKGTLLQCLDCMLQGIPIVVVDGCVGTSSVLAKRLQLKTLEVQAAAAPDGAVALHLRRRIDAARCEYVYLLEDSFLHYPVDERGDLAATVDKVVEIGCRRQLIRSGRLGATDNSSPQEVVLQTVLDAETYHVDVSWESSRPERGLRLEMQLTWHQHRTTDADLHRHDVFSNFRFLPTLDSADDPVLLSQLQMLKFVLMSCDNDTRLVASMLQAITPEVLGVVLNFTLSESVSEDGGKDERALHAATGRGRVVKHYDQEMVDIIDSFDDSDYVLPYHIIHARFLDGLAKAMFNAWATKKLHQQAHFQGCVSREAARTLQHGFTDDTTRFRETAVYRAKFLLSKGFMIARKRPHHHMHLSIARPARHTRGPGRKGAAGDDMPFPHINIGVSEDDVGDSQTQGYYHWPSTDAEKAYRYLQGRLAAHEYQCWLNSKVHTNWKYGEKFNKKLKTHPGMKPNAFEEDTVIRRFYMWNADIVLSAILEDFVVYRSSTLEDLYSYSGIEDAERKRLQHVRVLFPDGNFQSQFICSVVETWLQIPPKLSSILERHESADPYFALYIWALITNRLSVAKCLLRWQKPDAAVNALVGALICKEISHRVDGHPDVAPEVVAKYDAFQHELLDIAHDILQACHTHDAVRTVQALQTAFPNSGGVEVWWIAYLCNASRITAMPPFQTVIEQQWMAKIDHNSTAKIILGAFLPLYVCFWGEQHNLISKSALRQAFVDRTKWSLRIKVADIGEEADSKAFFAGNPTSVASGIVYYRLKYFYRAPITAFYIDVVFFIVFLCMFSVSALLRTVSWAEILSLQSNANWIQLVTYTWLLTHILDEVEQCLYQGLAVWKLSKWNLADCVMYSWITFGLLLRISPDITLLNYSRIIVAIGALMLWLRFTRHFAYSKLLGPKMFMVLAMIGDVAVFVALLLVVLIGYGVAVLAVQQPFRTLDLSTYIDVLLRPTFQVFGEVGLEDMLSEAHCSGDSDGGLSRLNSCPQNVYWGIFLLIFYMLFSNILLVNLLIAMMNSTYQNVDEAAIEIWSLQNIDLLREFRGPFPFPPPLNVVYYIYQGVVVAGTWLIRLPTRARVHPMASGDGAAATAAPDVPCRVGYPPLVQVLAFFEEHSAAALSQHVGHETT